MSADSDGYVMCYSQGIQVYGIVCYVYYYKNANAVCRVDIYSTTMHLVKTHSENSRDALASWVNRQIYLHNFP